MSFDWNAVKTSLGDFRWARVCARQPCPICQKPDWCTIREDGRVACCMRMPSDRPARCGGWIHDADEGHLDPRMVIDQRPPIDAELAYAQMFRDHDAIRFHDSCRDLGLSAKSVACVGGIYSPFYRALAWPTFRAGGAMTGIRVRYKWGAKRSVIGSRAGVFAHRSNAYDHDQPLLIVEGPTDTAAAFHLGMQAIGRPGCASYIDLVAGYAVHWAQVVVVADDDKPGLAGARRLIDDLRNDAGVSARLAVSPSGDLRAWVNNGATAEDARAWLHG